MYSVPVLLTRAVHWFQTKLLLLHLCEEHVLPIMLCMTAGLPKVKIVDVGTDHFVVFVLPILLLDVLPAKHIPPQHMPGTFMLSMNC